MGLTQHQPTPARRHFMMTSPRAQAAFHHQQFFFEQNEKLAHLLNTIGADARNATTISTTISTSCPASTTTTSSDYHELLTVTTHLLSEAQTLSTWTFDMIESNGPQVEPFAEKVALVERVAGELRERVWQLQQQQQQQQQMQHTTNTTTPTPNTAGSRSCNTSLSTSSKKRSRSGEDDDEEVSQQQQQYQHQQTNPPLSYKRSRVFAPAPAPVLRDHQYHQHQQQQSQQQELMPGIEPTTTSSCGTYAERFLQTPWWVQRPICD